jgi:hypothetical protein
LQYDFDTIIENKKECKIIKMFKRKMYVVQSITIIPLIKETTTKL